MRAVVQRVKSASVSIGNELHSKIASGVLVLLGISTNDSEVDLEYIFKKIVNLRIFDDKAGVMNESILDQDKEILLVSQFTLLGDARKGNRPSYIHAARPEQAIPLYESFITKTKELGIEIETGVFGEDMDVSLINDGPVTIILDSTKLL